ncbi:SH3 domain-containing protein [Streptomyces sp. NPDC048304]|uniref:SH3 domain-containing protein n=1 Tax=unclassified Streptomyces TaxID=2593676 RepID=UPI0033E3F686
MSHARRKAAVVAAGAASVLATAVAFAPAASADAFRCGSFGSDPRAWCAYVQKAPSGLKVRTRPSTSAPVAFTLANGTKVEVDCWTTGTSVNGYTVWDRLYSAGGGHYVSDYYLTTGHVQSYVDHC